MKFLYRNSVQLNFPVTLKSFLIHFLEGHARRAFAQSASQYQCFRFSIIFKSHFTDQQQVVSLDIDSFSMASEDLIDCIERNISHLSFKSPVSSFDIIAVSKAPPRWSYNKLDEFSNVKKYSRFPEMVSA